MSTNAKTTKEDNQSTEYIGKKQFKRWLLSKSGGGINKDKPKSVKAYTDNLYYFWQNLEVNEGVILNSSEKKLREIFSGQSETEANCLDVIAYFIFQEKPCYVFTITDAIRRLIPLKKCRQSHKDNLNSYLNKYEKFLRSGKLRFPDNQTFNEAILKAAEKIEKTIPIKELHKIDGVRILASVLGEKKFIQHAIEGSYFFSTEIVGDRIKELQRQFEDINKMNQKGAVPGIKNDKIPRIPIRYTKRKKSTNNDEQEEMISNIEEQNEQTTKNEEIETDGKIKYLLNWVDLGKRKPKQGTLKIGDWNVPVVLDMNGNNPVRSQIKLYTGYYSANKAEDNIFQNFIISHIWGQAYDPRFFTSLWNIVLVPEWANGLLDKQGKEDSLASKFKATIMAVCSELYKDFFSNDMIWSEYNMSAPQIINPSDVQTGYYKINIIGKKSNNEILGPITKEIKKIQKGEDR